LISLLSGTNDRPSAEELLRRAEVVFEEGLRLRQKPSESVKAFRDASSLYEQLRQLGAHNADLYRNQGNAYVLAGEVPQALMAYWRGRSLAPRDPALRAGQAYARSLVTRVPANASDWVDSHYQLWKLLGAHQTHFLVAMGTAFALCALAILVSAFMPSRRKQAFYLVLAALLVGELLGLCLASDGAVRRELAVRPLVVVAEDGVHLRTGNGLCYPARSDRPPLNRGEEAILLRQRGEWLQIQLPRGEVGWVNQSSTLVDR
jgi:hypothetical protein